MAASSRLGANNILSLWRTENDKALPPHPAKTKNEVLANAAHKLLDIKDGELEKFLAAHNVSLKACQEMMQQIHDWYDRQPHLPKGGLNDQPLLRFLIFTEFRVEMVKEMFDNYITARNKMPDLLKNTDPLAPQISKILKEGLWYVLPKKTPENHRVCLFKMSKPSKDLVASDVTKLTLILGEYRLWNDVVDGDHWVFDFTHYSLQMALTMTPMLISKISFYFTQCLSMKLKGMHLINLPSYAEAAINLFKRAMKPKVQQRIHVHANYDDLMKVLPKDIIPSDFGGTGVSSQEITDNWAKVIQSPAWIQYFKDQDKLVSDESKREVPTKLDEIFGVEGSFRKLDID